jgi:hypothetical protein
MYDEERCGRCTNKFSILQEQQEELLSEKLKKADRVALKPTRGRKPKGDSENE